MRLLPAALLSVLLIPCLVEAGAWPRDAGKGFLSGAVRLSWPQDLADWTSVRPTQDYQTLYLEYGLTERITLGFDIGRSVSGGSKTVAFAQVPLRDKDTGPKLSAQLGFGQISGDMVLRPGLSIGWGVSHGWLTFDAQAEVHLNDGATDYKLDATWGRNFAEDWKAILQLQTGVQHSDPPFVRLAPSLVTPVGRGFKTEMGVTYGITGDSSMGLKIGFWRDF
ncbi:hypothetical protein GGQ68_001153 [Sagittula marina]|uniref:Uncharacterized protein n=1 Tax=Sagittula marina TaxID=943940 RepID=A0A7W6DQ14_9RHOB|nr:hypothetical protein [Sagittula marina]MBB3984837.1 hypothetical protein [Sagittula marina]